MKRIKVITIIVSILVIITFLSFTYVSAIDEPKLVTKPFFSVNGFRDHPYPSPFFSGSFNLSGINGTFQFQFNGAYPTFFKPEVGDVCYLEWINVTKTNQKSIFGIGNLSVMVDKVNLTETDGPLVLFVTSNNTSVFGVPNQSPVKPFISISNPLLKSESTSFFFGTVLGNYTNISEYNGTTLGNFINITECNISISIEITPYIELGPYYKIGTPVWISYNYEFG